MTSVDQVVKDELRGQPFIAERDEQGHLRICPNCFYGVVETERPTGIRYAGKCLTSGPGELFSEDPLRETIDGKQVGHYCPCFADYSDFEEI